MLKMRYLIISLVFLFAFFTYSDAHSQTQVIEMTANGFEPQNITIDENSAVIFINKDKQARWPASNIHPTHDIYPQFDPKKSIEIGQSWSFKPKKKGEWKYHDHLLPHLRGVIKVTAEEGSSSTINPPSISLWEQLKKQFDNLFTKIKNLVNFQKIVGKKSTLSLSDFKKLTPDKQINEIKLLSQSLGSAKAWEYIKEGFKDEGGSIGNIHDLAHLSGSLLYIEKGFDGIGSCSQDFAFGCYHGFLDEAFKKDLDHLLDAERACLKLGPENSGPVASCIHGIGHGVASFHSTADLKASLSSCRKLTSGREYCFDGVFMEFVRSAPDTFFKADDPLYPCNTLEKEFG